MSLTTLNILLQKSLFPPKDSIWLKSEIWIFNVGKEKTSGDIWQLCDQTVCDETQGSWYIFDIFVYFTFYTKSLEKWMNQIYNYEECIILGAPCVLVCVTNEIGSL